MHPLKNVGILHFHENAQGLCIKDFQLYIWYDFIFKKVKYIEIYKLLVVLGIGHF